MAAFTSMPVEIKMKVLQHLSNDDFYSISSVSGSWYRACHLYKFPLEEVSLHTINAHSNELNVSISGRYYHDGATSAVFEQVEKKAVVAHFVVPGGHQLDSVVYECEDENAFQMLAIDYFFQILKNYRVARVKFDLFDRANLLPLLTEKTSKLRYRCDSLVVAEATPQQISVLFPAFQAQDYLLYTSTFGRV